MGLSVLFRSPCFPLWLSVENRAVEFVGLESGLGLEMGEFFRPAVRDSRVGNGCTGSHGFSCPEKPGVGTLTMPCLPDMWLLNGPRMI